jgi:hypothetical protein
MIHGHVEWSDPHHHQQLESGARADALLAPDCRRAVVGALRSWAKIHLTAVENRTASEDMQFPSDCPADLRAALNSPARYEPYSDSQLLAWSIRAEALVAEFLSTTPNDDVAVAFYDFGDAPRLFWRALEHYLACAKGEQREAWIEFIATSQPDLVAALSHDTELAVNRTATAWTERKDPFVIFEGQYRRYRSRGETGSDRVRRRMSLLLSLSPEAWMQAIDKMPVPTLMWEAVALMQLRSSAPLIERLITSAPEVFESDGAWTGSVAALLVSDLVADQLQAVHGDWRQLLLPASDNYSCRSDGWSTG